MLLFKLQSVLYAKQSILNDNLTWIFKVEFVVTMENAPNNMLEVYDLVSTL